MYKKSFVAIIFFIVGALLTFLLLREYQRIRSPERTAVWRGREIARRNGCFNCHGGEGLKGIRDPGNKYDEVPAWQGQTTMMFLKDTAEIRQYVLHGKPDRKTQKAEGLLQMPSFEGKITGRDLEDLIKYLKAVTAQIPIRDSAVQKGYTLARDMGCFGCHGPYGLGGGHNPGSFKGYIPGWDGVAFTDLVKNQQELKDWIMDGKIKRLEQNKAAGHFTSQQAIRMPAYRDQFSTEDLELVTGYIHFVRMRFKGWK